MTILSSVRLRRSRIYYLLSVKSISYWFGLRCSLLPGGRWTDAQSQQRQRLRLRDFVLK